VASADTATHRAVAQWSIVKTLCALTNDMSVIRTFIVEDSPLILAQLSAMLEEMASVQVVGSAADEPSALQRLRRLAEDVDLVIIDIFLKQGSGLGVLRGTTQDGRHAKRVILTNYATPDMRERCKALGAHRVFDKSTDLDELVSYCTRLGGGLPDAAPGALN
jgi:DNA-binding NarL/FixJ family response regulator